METALTASAGRVPGMAGRGNRGPRCAGTNRRGKPCGALAGTGELCAIHAGRLDPAELGRKGGSAPRASVAELRARIDELEAELWRTQHALELSSKAGASRSLEATLAMIEAL